MALGKPQSAPPQPAGGRRRWGWPLLTALLVVWAFALGVMVGQGTLANQEQIDSAVRMARGLPVVGQWLEEDERPPAKGLGEVKLSFYNDIERRTSGPAAAVPPPKAAPPTTVKATKDGAKQSKRYAVQVASMRDQNQAQRLVKRLKKSGFEAYVVASEIKGLGLRYRVRVGSFEDFDQARAMAGRIKIGERLDALVTPAN